MFSIKRKGKRRIRCLALKENENERSITWPSKKNRMNCLRRESNLCSLVRMERALPFEPIVFSVEC